MTITVSRRRWLLSAAVSTVSLSPLNAQSPTQSSPRIASLATPSRIVRLGNVGKTQTVVTAIAVDPRGEYVAAAGDDFKIRILRIGNLSTAATLAAHRDVIRTLDFDPQGNRLVSAGNDGQLILWDREESFQIRQQMQGTTALTCVRFSPDGSQMAAVGFANELFLIGRGRQGQPRFQCDCRDLRAVAYRNDYRVLAVAGRSGELHLFDPQSGDLIGEDALHRGRIHAMAFQSDANTIVCVSEDGSVSIFDTENRRLVRRIPVTTGKLFAVAILNSQLVAVAGSDNTIRVVNTDDATIVRKLTGHSGSVSTLAATGGVLFSGSYDATLRRWSIDDIDSPGQRIAEGDPRIDR